MDPVALVDATIRVLDEARFRPHAILISFDWRALRHAQKVAPDIPTGYITIQQGSSDNVRLGQPGISPWMADIDVAAHGSVPKAVKAAGGAYWSSFHRDLTPAALAEARALGLGVNVWTLRVRRDLEPIRTVAPDFVTTDRPDWLK